MDNDTVHYFTLHHIKVEYNLLDYDNVECGTVKCFLLLYSKNIQYYNYYTTIYYNT